MYCLQCAHGSLRLIEHTSPPFNSAMEEFRLPPSIRLWFGLPLLLLLPGSIHCLSSALVLISSLPLSKPHQSSFHAPLCDVLTENDDDETEKGNGVDNDDNKNRYFRYDHYKISIGLLLKRIGIMTLLHVERSNIANRKAIYIYISTKMSGWQITR